MKGNFFLSASFYIIMLLFASCLWSCTSYEPTDPIPHIVVSPEGDQPIKTQINGKVEGANPALYNLVVYGKRNDYWFTMHDKLYPIIPIGSDFGWVCNLLVEDGESLSEIAIFLIPNGYAPPLLSGTKIIPLKMNIVSTAKHIIFVNGTEL
ncbi:MAG: hypothetical protein HC819_05505 [Cyclobacteriaceae bacterium]|nr:hypothetical protein [Cyclobacteriaceae bacterium]